MDLKTLASLTACSVLGAAPLAHAATLLAHYQFEDSPTGTTVADSAPVAAGDNSGTLNGNASLVSVTGAPATAAPGLGGQALSLDGNGDFVNLTATSASILNSRTAFSIAAFVNITSYTGINGTGDVFFVSHSGSAGGGRGVLQFISTNGTIRSFARASTTETLGNVDELTNSGAVGLGTWTHVAATYDIANNDIQIYVNGTQVGLNGGQTFAAGTIDNLNSLFVGLGANNNGTGEFFNGLMDDVRLYDGVLTAAEVSGLAVTPEPASLGLLTMGALALGRRRRD